MISGTAWATASGTKSWLPSANPPIPRFHNHSGLESRANTNPTSLSSVYGGTLSLCRVFYGFSRVVLPEGVGGATFSDPEAAGREDEVQRCVPRQGSVVVRQCDNSMQDAVLDVHDTVI
jgi:hypothetical protein